MHVFPPRRDVDVADLVAVEPDAAAELHAAAAQGRRQVVQPDAARIEVHGPVDGVERVRHRKMAEATIRDRRAAGELRLPQRAVDPGRHLGPARAADLREEPLEHAEARIARRLERDAIVAEIDPARDAQPRAFVDADQLQILDAHLLLVERDADGPAVLELVVEQTHLDGVDRRVDTQVIHVRELAEHAHHAGDRRGREGR